MMLVTEDMIPRTEAVRNVKTAIHSATHSERLRRSHQNWLKVRGLLSLYFLWIDARRDPNIGYVDTLNFSGTSRKASRSASYPLA